MHTYPSVTWGAQPPSSLPLGSKRKHFMPRCHHSCGLGGRQPSQSNVSLFMGKRGREGREQSQVFGPSWSPSFQETFIGGVRDTQGKRRLPSEAQYSRSEKATRDSVWLSNDRGYAVPAGWRKFYENQRHEMGAVPQGHRGEGPPERRGSLRCPLRDQWLSICWTWVGIHLVEERHLNRGTACEGMDQLVHMFGGEMKLTV